MNLDKIADLCVSGNGDVHVTAKEFFLDEIKTAGWTHVSHARRNVADTSPARISGRTLMIDLAARL